MGIIDRLRRKAPAQSEEISQEFPTFEVEESAVAKKISEIEPIFVKSMAMQNLAEVQGVANELRLGNIVVIDITSLMEQDPADLKRAIDQLKGICQGIGGDVGRLTETKVLATPKFVRILFKEPGV
jgi:SepF-like predicted cell division protein (DUF552 family)